MSTTKILLILCIGVSLLSCEFVEKKKIVNYPTIISSSDAIYKFHSFNPDSLVAATQRICRKYNYPELNSDGQEMLKWAQENALHRDFILKLPYHGYSHRIIDEYDTLFYRLQSPTATHFYSDSEWKPWQYGVSRGDFWGYNEDDLLVLFFYNPTSVKNYAESASLDVHVSNNGHSTTSDEREFVSIAYVDIVAHIKHKSSKYPNVFELVAQDSAYIYSTSSYYSIREPK